MSDFTDEEAIQCPWPVRPDTPAARVDEELSAAALEILDLVYKQPGISRAARQELAKRISEVMGTARMRIARELGEGSA
jgi:hypothetical protein